MPLIVAIEPDRRQASRVSAIAHECLEAELVIKESTDEALEVLADRVPDLILTSFLLSPRDGARLADRLRELDTAGTHVQTLVIPMLASATPSSESRGLLTKLRRTKKASGPDGCDPKVFGAQIAEYLAGLVAERERAAQRLKDSQALVPAGYDFTQQQTQRTEIASSDEQRDKVLGLPAASTSVDEPVHVASVGADSNISDGEAIPAQPDVLETPDDLAASTSAWSLPDTPTNQDTVPATAHQKDDIEVGGEPTVELIADELAELLTPVESETVVSPEPESLRTGQPGVVTSEPEGVGTIELGDEWWKDLGFAPDPNERHTAEIAELSIDGGDSDAGRMALSAEPIDLASFVADLRHVQVQPLELETPAPFTSVPEAGASQSSGVDESIAAAENEPGAQPVPETSQTMQSLPAVEGPGDSIPSEATPDQESSNAPPMLLQREPATAPAPPSASLRPAAPSPELLQMLAAIRQGLERMRTDVGRVPGSGASASRDEPSGTAKARHGERLPRSSQKHQPPSKADKLKRKRNKRRTVEAPPPQDEWDFFDPEQCGFAALIAKLQEVSEGSQAIAPAPD